MSPDEATRLFGRASLLGLTVKITPGGFTYSPRKRNTHGQLVPCGHFSATEYVRVATPADVLVRHPLNDDWYRLESPDDIWGLAAELANTKDEVAA